MYFSWFYLTLFNSSGRFGHTRIHFQHCLLYCEVSIFPTAPFSPQLHFPHSCEENGFDLKGDANLIRYSDLCIWKRLEETLSLFVYPQQKIVARAGYWTPVCCVWSQDSTTELSCLWWSERKYWYLYITQIYFGVYKCAERTRRTRKYVEDKNNELKQHFTKTTNLKNNRW